MGFMIFNSTVAQTHGFNAKIGFEKYAPRPKILSKKCQKSAFQTKPAKFDTFWLISRDSVHILILKLYTYHHHSSAVAVMFLT